MIIHGQGLQQPLQDKRPRHVTIELKLHNLSTTWPQQIELKLHNNVADSLQTFAMADGQSEVAAEKHIQIHQSEGYMMRRTPERINGVPVADP